MKKELLEQKLRVFTSHFFDGIYLFSALKTEFWRKGKGDENENNKKKKKESGREGRGKKKEYGWKRIKSKKENRYEKDIPTNVYNKEKLMN